MCISDRHDAAALATGSASPLSLLALAVYGQSIHCACALGPEEEEGITGSEREGRCWWPNEMAMCNEDR